MQLKGFIQSYPNFIDCTIQTFDDNVTRKSKELAQKFSVKTVNRQTVKDLNDKGAWVFFSVNSMKQWKRDKESVTHLNTRIVESDTLSKEEQDKLIQNAPIKPSCVIESNKSYHIYYFSEDATIENWERVNRWLMQYYHGDQSLCSDTARVLRLPWTYHRKWEPYKIECKFFDNKKHKEKDMLEMFPYTETIKEKQKEKVHKPNITKARNIREIMWLQSNRYMLERLSRSRLVSGESISFDANSDWTDQIIVNWQSTWSWIDRNDYIWSSKKWWPTRVQWCVYYWNSKTDIYKRFIEYCDDLIPREFDRTKQMKEMEKIQQEEIQEKAIEERKQNFRHITYEEKLYKWIDELLNITPDKVMKRWREERDNLLGGIYWWKIYLIWADTWVWKSTFVTQVAMNLSASWVKVARYSLEDRMEDSAKEDIYYKVNQYRHSQGREPIERIKFVNGEYTTEWYKHYSQEVYDDIVHVLMIIKNLEITELEKNKDVSIDDLADLMEEECDKWTRVFIIDHLHYFQYENSKDRMDLQIENAMKKINDIARRRDVAVFVVAHYSTMWSNSKPTMNSFKGSSSIKQIANIIIQISRDDEDNTTTFTLSKIRWPIKKCDITATFDIKKFEYNFTKTEEQIKKEKDNKKSFYIL